MGKKFELTTDAKMFFGRKLFRIKALVSFGNVKSGDLGGYVEKESNLSHDGNAWICGDAKVYGNAWVCGNAEITDDSDYICFKGLGSENRNTTVFKSEDKQIFVKCGCFAGTLAEFEAKVKKTHGDSKFAKEYLAAVEVVKIHFECERNNNT